MTVSFLAYKETKLIKALTDIFIETKGFSAQY